MPDTRSMLLSAFAGFAAGTLVALWATIDVAYAQNVESATRTIPADPNVGAGDVDPDVVLPEVDPASPEPVDPNLAVPAAWWLEAGAPRQAPLAPCLVEIVESVPACAPPAQAEPALAPVAGAPGSAEEGAEGAPGTTGASAIVPGGGFVR
jgi:hypothetical protein